MLTKEVWNLAERDFPGTAPVELQLRFLVRYAILAPSVRNSQPWRFAVEGNRVELLADLRRGLPVADPDQRELYISLGCALENLLVAAEHFGFRHEVSYLPTPDSGEVAASVAFAPGGIRSPARDGIALEAILARHNDNSVFRPIAVPPALCRCLQACQTDSEPRFDLTADQLFCRWVERLTLEADRREFADPEFRNEVAHWIGHGGLSNPGLAARVGSFAVAHLDLGESVARQDHRIVESAALLGVISTTNDTHLDHIRTGQLFERIWLTATTMGITIHPMSQTMRRPESRSAVAELLPVTGWTPQHLFRVGYSSREAPRFTPRRPLEEALGEPH
jgi:nitroreductase